MSAGWARARSWAPCAALALLLAASGCGYKTGELFRPDIKTVYVEMFESKEFRRDMEFWLTEAVKKRIGSDTPYRLAPKEKADTILTGELLEERQVGFSPQPKTRYPRDQQLTLAIRVQWKDLRTGKILVDQPVMLATADYLPFARDPRFLAPKQQYETEQFGQTKAVDKLAQRIVAKMYDEW